MRTTNWLFELLGVSPNSNCSDIRRGARRCQALVHPDKWKQPDGEPHPEATAAAQLVNHAYITLCQFVEATREIINLSDCDSDPEPQQAAPSSPSTPSSDPVITESLVNLGEFMVGKVFASIQEAKHRLYLYAEQQGFVVRMSKDRTKNKGLGYFTCQCSRSGKPEVKTTTQDKQRNRASDKCGCKFHVNFKIDPELPMHAVVVCVASTAHTNGCNPSSTQRSASLRTQGTCIPTAVLSSLLALVRVNGSCQQIRTFLLQHQVHGLDLGAQGIRNLKLRVVRAWKKDKLHNITVEELAQVSVPDDIDILFAEVYKLSKTDTDINEFVEAVSYTVIEMFKNNMNKISFANFLCANVAVGSSSASRCRFLLSNEGWRWRDHGGCSVDDGIPAQAASAFW